METFIAIAFVLICYLLLGWQEDRSVKRLQDQFDQAMGRTQIPEKRRWFSRRKAAIPPKR